MKQKVTNFHFNLIQFRMKQKIVHLHSYVTKSLLRCFLNNLLIIFTSFLIEHDLISLNTSELIQGIIPDVFGLLALTSKT